MACPVCSSLRMGQVGRERYYCKECCHEWVESNGRIKVFKIMEDGELFRLKLFSGKQREVIGHG